MSTTESPITNHLSLASSLSCSPTRTRAREQCRVCLFDQPPEQGTYLAQTTSRSASSPFAPSPRPLCRPHRRRRPRTPSPPHRRARGCSGCRMPGREYALASIIHPYYLCSPGSLEPIRDKPDSRIASLVLFHSCLTYMQPSLQLAISTQLHMDDLVERQADKIERFVHRVRVRAGRRRFGHRGMYELVVRDVDKRAPESFFEVQGRGLGETGVCRRYMAELEATERQGEVGQRMYRCLLGRLSRVLLLCNDAITA